MILFDSCVWVDYFKNKDTNQTDILLETKHVVTSDIILAEVLPVLFLQKNKKAIKFLLSLRLPDCLIDWRICTQIQTVLKAHGYNGIGLLDVAIAYQAFVYDIPIYTFDKHFEEIQTYFTFSLYQDTKL